MTEHDVACAELADKVKEMRAIADGADEMLTMLSPDHMTAEQIRVVSNGIASMNIALLEFLGVWLKAGEFERLKARLMNKAGQ